MSLSYETREQRRMRLAYDKVGKVPATVFKEYKSLVEGLGAQILQSGLCMAMAFLERNAKSPAQIELLKHLAAAELPGLGATEADATRLPKLVRGLSLDEYMLATRELLKQLTWLKRAAQARGDGGST